MEAVAVALLLGATLAALTPVLPGVAPAALLVAAGFALIIVRRFRLPGWALVGAGWLTLGGNAALSDRLPAERSGEDFTLVGRIASVPEVAGDRVRFLFEPDPATRPVDVPSRIRLSWYDRTSPPDPRRRWRLRVRLRPPGGLANPGGFDYERWLLEQGIGATGYVRRSSANAPIGPAGPAGALLGLRLAAADAMDRIFGERRAGGIVKALTLGLRGGLGEETREVLRATGTAHLMAISGLHVGMVAGLGILLGRGLWSAAWRVLPGAPGGPGRRGWAAFCGWLCALGYTLLAGAGLPARRALLMLTVGMLMLASRRRLGPAAPLAAAALALFAVDPLAVLSPGFWLSLVAVAGLTVGGLGRIALPRAARRLILAQASVGLALLLPGLLVFGGLPAYGPAVNLLAVPLFGLVVVPLALAGLVALVLADGLAATLWWPLAGLLDGLLATLTAIAALPGAWLRPVGPPAWVLALAALAGAALLLPGSRVARCALVPLILPALFWRPLPLPHGDYRLAVLDVGQGLSVVVETRSRVLVFDAGPAWRSGRDAGAAVVSPYLQARGIRRIDALVLSHGDGDHRGGADSLARRLPIGRRWVGPDTKLSDIAGTLCARGAGWHWDGVDFRFLHPAPESRHRGNDSSCVLLIDGPGGRTLLPGDIEARAEAALVAGPDPLAADLVVAPHHGSATSSTPAFVRATKPRWVVVPAGHGNRWGFPAAAVRDRWQGAGARLWSTGEQGAVALRFPARGEARPPRGTRCSERRFWRRADCHSPTPPARVPGPGNSQYDSADPAPPWSGPDG